MTEPKANVPAVRPEPESAAVAAPLTMEEKMSPAALALTLWTSLPIDTPEGKALTIALAQGGDDAGKIGDRLNTVIDVRHLLVHTVTVIDDNGEEFEADRIVMIGPKGETVACTSKGVRKSLQFIMGMYGMPPWEPPMRLMIKQKDTRRGRRFYTLHPVADAQVAPDTSKKPK